MKALRFWTITLLLIVASEYIVYRSMRQDISDQTAKDEANLRIKYQVLQGELADLKRGLLKNDVTENGNSSSVNNGDSLSVRASTYATVGKEVGAIIRESGLSTRLSWAGSLFTELPAKQLLDNISDVLGLSETQAEDLAKTVEATRDQIERISVSEAKLTVSGNILRIEVVDSDAKDQAFRNMLNDMKMQLGDDVYKTFIDLGMDGSIEDYMRRTGLGHGVFQVRVEAGKGIQANSRVYNISHSVGMAGSRGGIMRISVFNSISEAKAALGGYAKLVPPEFQ